MSVRESVHIEFLKSLGLDSICVPDPTMLLSKSDYELILTPPNQPNDIFVYFLHYQDTSVDVNECMDYLYEKAPKTLYTNATENGKVESISKYDALTDFFPTIGEWLGVVRDSKIMVTNSFHGCVFAIIMNTPFYALKLIHEGQQSRIDNLLSIFGLENRLISDMESLKRGIEADLADSTLDNKIDWEVVNEKLRKWSQVGKDYLHRNI